MMWDGMRWQPKPERQAINERQEGDNLWLSLLCPQYPLKGKEEDAP
jgi:hypothetical protein